MVMRPLALVIVALSLAACGGTAAPDIAPPNPVSSLHVDRVRVQYSAAFAPRSSELPYTESMRLETFLDQAGLRPDDRVYIASPSGDALATARTERIKSLLARRGVGAVAVEPPAGLAPDHIVVLADRYVVTPPSCPEWSDSGETGHGNMPNSNFGCATLSNFALMLDNPRDVMSGRKLGPADAEPAIEAVQRLRTGLVKPLLSSQSGSAPGGAGAAPPPNAPDASAASPSTSGAGAAASGAAAGMTSP
jgi:pilus assembly protein CpaD